MNWKIIILLTLLGVLAAIASLFGWVNSTLLWWLIIGIISGIVIAKTCKRSLFIHGVVVGLFSGILGSVIQSIFFDMYLRNNSTSLDGFKNLTEALPPQYVLLFSGPFFGIAYGIVVGLIAMAFGKLFKKNTN